MPLAGAWVVMAARVAARLGEAALPQPGPQHGDLRALRRRDPLGDGPDPGIGSPAGCECGHVKSLLVVRDHDLDEPRVGSPFQTRKRNFGYVGECAPFHRGHELA